MRIIFTLILLNFTWFAGYAQTRIQVIDTIKIYKSQAGIRYKIYEKEWFPGDRDYGYFDFRINKQDRLVLEIDTLLRHYFKVFNARNRLMLEGLQGEFDTSLSGEVKFYRRNKSLLRVEYWKSYHSLDTASLSISIGDGPQKVSSTKYRRNGSVKKLEERLIRMTSLSPMNYCLMIKTTRYKRNLNKSVSAIERKCFIKENGL